MIASVGVLGGGAWGTALALVAARSGRKVNLWARNISVVSSIRANRENPKYLPGIALDPPFGASAHFPEVVGADILLVAVPAQLKGRPSVLRIAYALGRGEDAARARARLDAVAERVRELWRGGGEQSGRNDESRNPLVIETELEGVQ